MRARTVLIALLGLLVAGVCVRLGNWQLGRMREKQERNVELRAALVAPPRALGDSLAPDSALSGRVVEARGRFDETRHVLLAARLHQGTPGVHLVTPLVLAGGEAILVDRGWLPTDDATTADPEAVPARGEQVIRGWADTLRHGAGGPPIRTLPGPGSLRLSAHWLDAESLAPRLPYRLAGVWLAALPDSPAGALPIRPAPRMLDESQHAGYAAQWFLFAVAAAAGSALVLWRDSRRRARPSDGAP